MTILLDQGQGYGRAAANGSESWELQGLPAGYVFCAMMSIAQDYDHAMYVYVNGVVVMSTTNRNTATIKVSVPVGATVRIDVECQTLGYYAIGWGHSEMDSDPGHWEETTPTWRTVTCEAMSAWTPISKSWFQYNKSDQPQPTEYRPDLIREATPEGLAENYLRAARFGGTRQPVDANHSYDPEPQNVRLPVNSPVLQAGYDYPQYPAKGSYQMGPYYNGMGWVGYKINQIRSYSGVANDSQVWQTGEVFKLPETKDFTPPILPTEVGNHPEEAWGTIALGSEEGQFRGGTFRVTKLNSSINRPGDVIFRMMEPGSFTKDLIDTPYVPEDYESYFLNAYPKGQLNHWGPTHIGFQNGIGFPMHTTSMMSPGGTPVNFWGDSNGDPGQNYQPYGPFPYYNYYVPISGGDPDTRPTTLSEQVEFTFESHETFAAHDLSEPGNTKRYIGVSAAIANREQIPESWSNQSDPYYASPHAYNVTMFKGLSMTKEYLAPTRLKYRGFPLFGSLKVKTEDGFKTAGIYEIRESTGTLGVLHLRLPNGVWVKSFWQGFLYGQGWGTPLKIKVEDGWEVAALMIEDQNP